MSADLPLAKMSRERINQLLAAQDWRHLRPILVAVRDHRIGLLTILQGDRVDLAPMLRKRPSVIIVGDDACFAFGPAGFDPDTLRAALIAAERVVMAAGEPDPAVYRGAADFAARERRHCVIVETRHEVEAEWRALAARYATAGAR